ncbi:hypothetical protein KM043_017644 [Ampulex compressa]|nr:hypothetical protein KM043_017644 [Ampulex compressa]
MVVSLFTDSVGDACNVPLWVVVVVQGYIRCRRSLIISDGRLGCHRKRVDGPINQALGGGTPLGEYTSALPY